MQWPLEMQWPPCDRHGIMIKFSNCEEGKLSMVKLSRFAKIHENRESFDVYGSCRPHPIIPTTIVMHFPFPLLYGIAMN